MLHKTNGVTVFKQHLPLHEPLIFLRLEVFKVASVDFTLGLAKTLEST